MSEVSANGLESIGFPATTLESLRGTGDTRVLGWLREAVQEGDRLNRADPMYDEMARGMAYVSGEQRLGPNAAPKYIQPVQINESRKVIQAHTSALTDLKPLFSYKATNPAFALQADLMNRLTVAWWITSMADLELGHVIKYALAAGTGDCVTEWDPHAGYGGDARISARDARDTLPIRPAPLSRSIQGWDGLILRESHTVNVLKGLYPQYTAAFRPTTDSLLSTLMGRFKSVAARLLSPGDDTLAGLNQPAAASRVRSGEILLYRMYLTDRSSNMTTKPIPMGTPGSAWAYVVQPGQRLYPYKRLIVATPELTLYDGPGTYWHGQYPVSRLKLWDLPWHFLGRSLLADLTPLQDAINTSAQDILLGIRKWMDPTTVYNRGAVSENFMRLFDARRPGAKVKLTLDATKEPFRQLDGPPPAILQIAMENMNAMLAKFDDLSGTPNLQQLLELRQLPGADTLQKYWEALTPELRQEGRQVEAFLRDLAEQLKVLRFQFESQAKRVTILGDAGLTMADFDFDPEVMVPSRAKDDPMYHPDLDESLTRDQRAQASAKSIVFTIAPNSILAMNAQEQKMTRMQLSRMGMYDFWSLGESLEIPNIGTPPPIPLPPLEPVDPQVAIQSIAAGEGKYTIDPASGQILQIRVPITVTERLVAQQQLGIGMAQSAAGRPATAQAPPKLEQKSDGRTTMTESSHKPGPNAGR